MKNKNKIITGSVLAFALLLVFGVSQANAFWGGGRISVEDRVSRQEAMFQEQATILGVTLDDVKKAWANGQSIVELAQSKGITEEALKEKMQAVHQERMKEELQALVSKGVITQAQADTRLKYMESNRDKKDGWGRKGHGQMEGCGGLFGGPNL